MAASAPSPIWLEAGPASTGKPRVAWTGTPCAPALRGSLFCPSTRASLESTIAALPEDHALAGVVGYAGDFELVPCTGWRCVPAELWPSPQPAQMLGPWQHSLERDPFLLGVRRIHDYIRAGDIYQVNLTRRSSAPGQADPRRLFARLQRVCPAPYAGYLELDGRTVLSASPEMFLRCTPGTDGLRIMTQPIKGSRPRYPDPARDDAACLALKNSDKEQAELVMITDLERNDLGQVCDFGSITVDELCALRTFSHVHHLVSTVSGLARPGETPLSVLTALFPGGSITGAPKKRAMSIIAELEPVPRGLYTGALGFFAHGQRSQWAIAIRTLELAQGQISYGVGSGITIGSDPEQEWAETQAKEAGLLDALGHNP